jgi:preprotein translocase subunit Sss1
MRERASQVLWFVGIWGAGVLAVGIVGYAIKLILKG